MPLNVLTIEQQATMTKEAPVDWNCIYREQAPRVYNYFRYRLGQHHEAEELTSRTFEKAWQARQRFDRDVASFSTWLYKIAHHVAVDYIRSQRSHVQLDEALNLTAEAAPEKDAELHSDLTRLCVLSSQLPSRDRNLIALKYGAVMNNREIARVTGLTESNVSTILHRLVQQLRDQW